MEEPLMGLGDKFDELKNKAKEAIGQHGDKVDEGVDRAGEFADEKTEGKYTDKIGQGGDKVKEGLERFGREE
jgi:uncharacterized protein YjbJ (UPF0337 family)